MADNNNILGQTLVINLGNSKNDVESIKQSIKDLRKAIKDMSTDQGKVAMLDGVASSISDLKSKVKDLETTLKSINKPSEGKSDVLKGTTKAIDETSEKLKTLKKQLAEVVELKDIATQTKNAGDVKKYGTQEQILKNSLREFNGDSKANVASIGELRNIAANAKYFSDKEKESKALSESLQRQMQARYDAEISTDKAIASTKERTAVALNAKYYADKERSETEFSSRIEQQMRARYAMEDANAKAIASTKERTTVALNAKYYADKERSETEFSSRIEQQMRARYAMEDANAKAIASTKERTAVKADKDWYAAEQKRMADHSARMKEQFSSGGFVSYAKQISDAKQRAEELYQVMKKVNTEESKLNFAAAKKNFEGLVKNSNDFAAAVGLGGEKLGLVGSLSQKIRGHFMWILAGELLNAFTNIPLSIQSIAAETEVLGAKLKQNLELADRYHGSTKALEGDISHLSDVAGIFAVGYGANVKDVMEMMQVLSRRFKSPEEITYYTNLAMTLHKLDFVAPKKAAEDLEAVILSMGLNFGEAKTFVDQFSVAVHTARITGSDLLSALQRSGAGFRNMNMGTAEAIALISTLSTVTAKSGSVVGNSLSSLITNVDFKKGADALKAYNIEVYDTVNSTGKMRDGVEIWRDMARVLGGLKADDNDLKANELANALSGGKFRINDLKAVLNNWQEFEKILKDIKDKASPDLTAELLKTGMQTYDNNVKQMSASLQVLSITIGNELLPMLKAITIGLTQGVEWLNNHRQEVSQTIKYMKLFAEALMLYKAWQFLATTELGKFIIKMFEVNRATPLFNSSLSSMGSSAWAFTKNLGLAIAQMAAFMAMAEVMSRVISGWRQDSAEKDFNEKIVAAESGWRDGGPRRNLTVEEQNIRNLQLERDQWIKDKAVDGKVGATGMVVFWNGDDQYHFDDLNSKINMGLQNIKMMEGLEKVNAMSRIAANGIKEDPKINPYSPVAGQDLGKPTKEGSAPTPPSDYSTKIVKDVFKDAQTKMFHEAKLSADRYKEALDDVTTSEELHGKTVENVNNRYAAMAARVQQLTIEEAKYSNEAQYLSDILDDRISTSEDLLKIVGYSQEDWKKLGNKEKTRVKLENREYLEQHELTKAITATMYKYSEAASTAKVSINGLTNDLKKLDKGDTENFVKQMERNIDIIKNQESIDTIRATDKLDPNNDKKLNDIKLKSLHKQQEIYAALKYDYETDIMVYENQGRKADVQRTQDSLRKVQQAYEQNAKEIKDIEYQKNSVIKEGLQSITNEVLLQGKSLKSVWNSLWKSLADDALKYLFKVKNSSGGLLGSVFGLFGGGTTKSTGTSTTSNQYAAYKNYSAASGTNGVFADGGIVSQPTNALIGETGEEEAVVNLGKLQKGDARQMRLLQYANSKLGKGGVTASVSSKTIETAKETASMTNLVSAQTAHLDKLDEQIGLLTQQNNMLLHLINSGGIGGSTVAQPIVVQQGQSNDALAAQLAEMKRQGYSV